MTITVLPKKTVATIATPVSRLNLTMKLSRKFSAMTFRRDTLITRPGCVKHQRMKRQLNSNPFVTTCSNRRSSANLEILTSRNCHVKEIKDLKC